MMNYSEENIRSALAERLYSVLNRAYLRLASITTAVYILGLMCVFYLAGTVFPQGVSLTEYMNGGGRLVFLVTLFDLLDFFTSPVFLILALALFLNLLVCTYERYPSLFVKGPYPAEFTPERSIALTQDLKEAFEKVREVFVKELGFRPVESESRWNVVEKGLPCGLLTWLFHAGAAVCFLGFALTYLFAYDGTMRLAPKKASTVVPRETGRLKSLWTEKDGPTDFHLYLEEFITEYSEFPDLDYPEDRTARLAIGLGWSSPSYELREDSLFVKDWKARIKVVRGNKTLREKTAEVNSPLKYGGYTFYLAGWADTVKVHVDGNPILLEVLSGDEIFVPGLLEPLVFGDVKSGRVFRLDGRTEDLRPFTTVKKKSGGGYEEAGKVLFGDSVTMNGHSITPAGFETGAVLNYRYDPGAGILWAGGVLLLSALALRIFIGRATAAYDLAEKDGIVFLNLFVSSEGLGYSTEKTVAALTRHLTKDDIRPLEIPPGE